MDFSKAVAEYKKLLAMKAAMELELPSFEKAVQNFKKSASKDLLDQLYQVEPAVPVEENSVAEPEKEIIEKSIENYISKHVEKPIKKIVPKPDNDDLMPPKMIDDSDSENHSSRIFSPSKKIYSILSEFKKKSVCRFVFIIWGRFW